MLVLVVVLGFCDDEKEDNGDNDCPRNIKAKPFISVDYFLPALSSASSLLCCVPPAKR